MRRHTLHIDAFVIHNLVDESKLLCYYTKLSADAKILA